MIDMKGFDRRELLKRAMILAGASAIPANLQALAAEPGKKPGARHLDAKRYALLIAVADTLVPRDDTPGAVDAGVPARFDALLRDWAAPDRRAKLTAALDRIEAKAQDSEKTAFADLPADKRHDLLSAYDAAALKPVPAAGAGNPLAVSPTVIDPKSGKPRQAGVISSGAPALKPVTSPFARGPAVADPEYAKLKELVVVLFYLSEQALTHDLAWEHDPGSWDPSIPITPQTRPWGGAGGI